MVGIIVVLKRKKSKQHTEQENIYYIDESAIKRPPINKPKTVCSEINDGQNCKEASASTRQMDNNVHMQNNPSYSILSEHQVKMQDNPSYSILSEHQLEMQDNPAYRYI